MFKKISVLITGFFLSYTAMASTIVLAQDDQSAPVKNWDKESMGSSSLSTYSQKQYITQTKVAKKTAIPLQTTPPKQTPFPARIEPPVENKYPWSLNGSVGYTSFAQAGDDSGGAVVGRFAIGKGLYVNKNKLFGLELGVQNGNRMSIGASQATLDEMGSLPIWTTSKPMVDLLATAQFKSQNHPVFFTVKGGVAYRTWETERQSINNLSQVAGEVQAGIGVPIVQMATLSIFYQGVFGGSTHFTVNSDASATVANIPTQNGVLLSLGILL